MYQKTTNTAVRAYAMRATLAATAAALTLAWQTAPSLAREHHRTHHHHHHRHHQAAETSQGTGAFQTQGFNAQASMNRSAVSGGRAFSGMASHYGTESGSRTASGQRMNPSAMTAAHRTLPFGTQVRVTDGGQSVVVTINDRGPFV